MRRIIALVLAAALTGCATATADYINLQTGQARTCRESDNEPPAWILLACVPCYFALRGSAYADCKTRAEEDGFIRRDAKTDAWLRYMSPTLSETLPPRTIRPAEATPSTSPILCRRRADAIGGTRKDLWIAEYRRCMAGE